MVKSKGIVTVISSIVLMTLAGTAYAVDVNIDLKADYFGKYIWRGQNLANESVFQPGITAAVGPFSVSIWGNLELTDKTDHEHEFTEFDYVLDYTDAFPGIEGLNYSIGTIYYDFPNTAYKPTTEVYGGLSFAMPLSPSFKWYRDLDEIDGSYFQLGLGHTFEKLKVWSDRSYCGLQLDASVGWGNSTYNKGYFSVDNEKFNDFTFSAGLPMCIGSWTIKTSVSYSTILGGEIREATAKSDNIWVGVGLSKSF
jgi:hypothetical protein